MARLGRQDFPCVPSVRVVLLSLYCSSDPAHHYVGELQLVLPHSDDAPSLRPKASRNAPVTRRVRLYFFRPVRSIASRRFVALRATMPKTTVGKDCKTIGRENNIWLSNELVATNGPTT